MRAQVILFAALAAGITLAAISCATANEQALARMSADQRGYLSKVDALRYGMSERQTNQIMGPPTRGRGTPRVCYEAPGEAGKSEICVRFELYKARYVEWLDASAEGFHYLIDLKERAAQP